MFLLSILLWWVIGSGSFLYWWTIDYDFTTKEFITFVFAGVLGPTGFIVGWCIHGDKSSGKILIKRRDK